MNKSDNINELATALAKAQGSMRFAIKDANNPFFKSKYADLSSVVEAIRDALASNGLSYMQHLHQSEKHEVCVETVILHASGQWISCGTVAIPVNKNDAQGFGSALTYARRYSLSAAVGVVADDDDGNAATASTPKQAQARASQQPTPMPEKVKQAAAAVSGKRKPAAPSEPSISGDPNEGNLDIPGVFEPVKPAQDKLDAMLGAFQKQLGMTQQQVEKECNFGPVSNWTVEQFDEAREVFKAMKIERQNMAAIQQGDEV